MSSLLHRHRRLTWEHLPQPTAGLGWEGAQHEIRAGQKETARRYGHTQWPEAPA